ncbi:hypothetical protein [Christiangramia salexigens]|uniref:Uncharacterized protein n=1 Tax=Christiangramia salexigens TaxID=1913577 RepID=A0A1L3J1Y6_9FLAO|nr:hypothetical protein [Christiangramia salexigens]APG59135.1 hypothetical protein LPB144_01370 [Christiangramia salexigens]
MRRLAILILGLMLTAISYAQQETYLTFEFMKVDNNQEAFYTETEAFWEKIHEQRVASGDIVGWDLWQLLPGGEDQGYQYLTVTVFDSPIKMMKAGEGILESGKMAYPDLSDEELEKRLNMAGGSRDLAVRLFLKVIDSTTDNFEMKPGMVATLDLMTAANGNSDAYEKAESEVFKNGHQKMIDSKMKGNWQLLKVLFPIGDQTYATHITANMYSGYDQFMKAMDYDGQESADMTKKMNEGLKTREMKFSYLANLLKMVR